MMPGWMMAGSGWGMGYGIFGWLMMLLFWILIVAGVVLVVRWFVDQGGRRAEETALDVLKKRYARGEIDREQFNTMKGELT